MTIAAEPLGIIAILNETDRNFTVFAPLEYWFWFHKEMKSNLLQEKLVYGMYYRSEGADTV